MSPALSSTSPAADPPAPPVHDWGSVGDQISIFPLELPCGIMVKAGGGAYELTVGALTRIVGGVHESCQRGRGRRSTGGSEEVSLVTDLVRSAASQCLLRIKDKTETSFDEGELYVIIERVLLDREMLAWVNMLSTQAPPQFTASYQVGTRIVYEDGRVGEWNPNRVEVSVRLALNAVGLPGTHAGFAAAVARHATETLERNRLPYMTSEEVRDIVEQTMVTVWAGSSVKHLDLFRAIRAYMTSHTVRPSPRKALGADTADAGVPGSCRQAGDGLGQGGRGNV